MKYIIFTFAFFFSFASYSQNFQTRVIADSLFIPWEIIYGADDHIWFTQKNGFICRLNPTSGRIDTLIHEPTNEIRGEGGMMGLAVTFKAISEVDIYAAFQYADGADYNLIVKKYQFNLLSQSVVHEDTLMGPIRGARNHNGCRLLIDQDKLFITTGDAEVGALAQDLSSLNGKVLRINLDGSIPIDNPINGSPIWSWGHRNAQGLVFHDNRLYSSEHGPNSDDEINIIQKGRNYGWPEVLGFCDEPQEQQFCADSNIVEPLIAWTPTIAPAGIDFYHHALFPEWQQSLLMTSLKDGHLHHLSLNANGDSILQSQRIDGIDFGRLRAISVSGDGRVFISTSNSPANGNGGFIDRIIEIYKESDNSLSNIDEELFSVYPNPANEKIYIKSPNNEFYNSDYYIIDLQGKIIKTGSIINPFIEVGDLSDGIYFLIINHLSHPIHLKFSIVD